MLVVLGFSGTVCVLGTKLTQGLRDEKQERRSNQHPGSAFVFASGEV